LRFWCAVGIEAAVGHAANAGFSFLVASSHPNDFNHTFQWLAELTGKAGRVVPSST
jgi:hypothetical protein